MSPLLRRISRLVFVVTLAACATDDPTFIPIVDAPADDSAVVDADPTDAPPGTATLTVTKDGTAAGRSPRTPAASDCGDDVQRGVRPRHDGHADRDARRRRRVRRLGRRVRGTATTCTVTLERGDHGHRDVQHRRVPGHGRARRLRHRGRWPAPRPASRARGTCTAMVPARQPAVADRRRPGPTREFVGWTVAGLGTAVLRHRLVRRPRSPGRRRSPRPSRCNQSLEVTKARHRQRAPSPRTPTGINCGARLQRDSIRRRPP
jgi:hypothetical protein